MEQKKYKIGQKEYSEEELYLLGVENSPKLYLISRIISVVIFPTFFFIEVVLGILTIVFANTMDKDFPLWAFYIPLIIIGSILVLLIFIFIFSFLTKTKKRYIKYGYDYVMKETNNGNNDKIFTVGKEKEKEETLARYERLLKGGVITQEEFDKKKAEL